MSQIKLYTPNTGLPDLELKIAYGLCRVAFEAGLEFTMTPRQGWWEVEVEGSGLDHEMIEERMRESLRGILKRFLSTELAYDLAGVDQRKDIKKYLYSGQKIANDFPGVLYGPEKGNGDTLCGHKKPRSNEPFDRELPTFLGYCFGGAYRSDKVGDRVCPICSWLGVLGLNSTVLEVQVKDRKEKAIITLEPLRPIETKDFAEVLSLQKALSVDMEREKGGLYQSIASVALPLAILGKYPSTIGLLWGDNKPKFTMRVYHLKKGNRWQTKGESEAKLEDMKEFLISSKQGLPNPYNLALLNRMLKVRWSAKSKKYEPVYDSERLWEPLVKVVFPIPGQERDSVISFMREGLVYLAKKRDEPHLYEPYLFSRKVTLYFAEEVINMKVEFFDMQTEEGKAIEMVSKILRYFVRQKDFGYLNDLMSSKNPDDLQRVLIHMLRTANSLADKEDEKGIPYIPVYRKKTKEVLYAVYLPRKEHVDCVMRLAAGPDFEDLKSALLLSGMSRAPKRGGEEPLLEEETTETEED